MSTNIQMAISELHKAFHCFNEALFNKQLPEPAILIQNRGNKKNVLGWCSSREIWINEFDKEKKYEINLVAESLNRPLYELMSTLLHEMIHLYNCVNNIKDVSRNGTYHNKAFKECAESHGLILEHDKRIGWSYSSLTPEAKDLVDSFCLNEEAFYLFRIDRFRRTVGIDSDEDEGEGSEEDKPRSSSRKYVCPGCGAIIRSTKDLRVICGECMVEFLKE
jgi:ribosomal protein S27AE